VFAEPLRDEFEPVGCKKYGVCLLPAAVEALGPDGTHKPFRDRVRARRSDRRLEHRHALGAQDLVKRARKLAVSVVQQVAHVPQALYDREVAHLLAHPGAVGVGGDPGQVHAPRAHSIQNSTYSVRSQAVSAVKKSQAQIPSAWVRRNSLQEGPDRRGAGPRSERRRILLIVVAPIRIPNLRSSPWIRTQPQRGFYRPKRSTSARTYGSSGGRRGKRRRYVHFLRISSRCQRSSVCGLTRNTGQRSLGRSVLATASSTRSLRRSGGRFTVRPSTASWWRATAFSTSSAATDELPTMTRSSLRIAKCTRRKNTTRSYGRLGAGAGANRSFRALHDRRRELLVNAYEELTLELLGGAAAPWGCRAAYKVRVADALTIDGSDLDAGEREYALMAHFDFVVVQGDRRRVLFAVEFDGRYHDTDDDARRRDAPDGHEPGEDRLSCNADDVLFPNAKEWHARAPFSPRRLAAP
jgi:hypothetical protein